MWRFGAISHACFKHGGCPDLTSRGDGSLAAASFFMIFIGQNNILSVPCSLNSQDPIVDIKFKVKCF